MRSVRINGCAKHGSDWVADSLAAHVSLVLAVAALLTGCAISSSDQSSSVSKPDQEIAKVERPKTIAPKKKSVTTKAEILAAMETTKNLYEDAVGAADDPN